MEGNGGPTRGLVDAQGDCADQSSGSRHGVQVIACWPYSRQTCVFFFSWTAPPQCVSVRPPPSRHTQTDTHRRFARVPCSASPMSYNERSSAFLASVVMARLSAA